MYYNQQIFNENLLSSRGLGACFLIRSQSTKDTKGEINTIQTL